MKMNLNLLLSSILIREMMMFCSNDFILQVSFLHVNFQHQEGLIAVFTPSMKLKMELL